MKCSGCDNYYEADINTGLCPECQARIDKSEYKLIGDDAMTGAQEERAIEIIGQLGKVPDESRLLTPEEIESLMKKYLDSGCSASLFALRLCEAQLAKDQAHEQSEKERIK